MMRVVRSITASCLFLVTLAACNSETGLSYESLSFSALETGSSGAPITRCITLPHLIGSEVDSDIELGDALAAHLIAMRDDVALTFTGSVGAGSDSRSITREELADDHTDQLSVTSSASGHSYSITLTSKCTVTKP